MRVTGLNFRKARINDLPFLKNLSEELGYLNSFHDLEKRFQEIEIAEDHQLLVATFSNGQTESIVGMAHFRRLTSFSVPAQLEITGVIVNSNHRSKGIGAALIEQATPFAQKLGLSRIRLTSNIQRNDAHRFYLRLGFKQVKTSHCFEKDLSAPV